MSVRNALLALGLIFAVMACGGGGCSACAGCGLAPIPGGYPIAERVENSAQVRLTQSGIGFIEDNFDSIIRIALPDGLSFAIPRSSGSMSGVDYTICPDADCFARGEIHDFTLTPIAPRRLQGHIQVVLDSRDATGGRRHIPVDIDPGWLPDATCEVDLDTREGSRPYVGLVADIDFEAETEAARFRYTKIVVSSADLAPGEDIEDDDVSIGGCTGYAWLLNLFKAQLISALQDQVSTLVREQADEALCTTRGEFGCPTGTFAVPDESPTSTCRYQPMEPADGEPNNCVPTLLGTDGQGDLGAAFLGSLSPGTHAPGQLLLAAGGPGEAINEGMTINMFGGFRSARLPDFAISPAHNPCVPVLPPPALPTITPSMAFRQNTIPGTSTPVHLGFGLAEDYLNFAAYGVFDSGMLCVGVGTRTSQQLSTGLFSALIGSLRNLAFPEAAAPIAIALRPQTPASIEVGAGTELEALLMVTLDDLAVDFYVWSSERYIRFMTFTSDLTLHINLEAMDGMIIPRIPSIDAVGPVVTNNELLSEDPASLADLIQTVLTMFSSMLTSSVGPIELPELMGFLLQIPEGGIRGVQEGDEEFLGIFANLALAPPAMPYSAAADTSATLAGVEIDERALRLETWGDGAIPRATLLLDASGPDGAEYEWQWNLDETGWSPWTRERRPTIESRFLQLQARHVLEVRSRIAGAQVTVDETPARVEILVDVLEPTLSVSRTSGGVEVTADDVITPREQLQYRFRADSGPWTPWGTSRIYASPYDDARIDVEVRDEAGNVAGQRAALIRGAPNPAAMGCECAAAEGGGPINPLGALLALGMIAFALFHKRNG
jgi:hypothetical protein